MITQHLTDKIATGETHVFQSATRPAASGKRLVLVGHGVGQNSLASAMSASRYMNLFQEITKAGLHVLHFDGFLSTNWGNDAAIQRVTDAWTWAKANLPVKTDKACLLGFSMGNVLMQNWAKANPTQVQGLASIIGVADVQDIRDNNRQSLAGGIEGAYNPVSLTDGGTLANNSSFVSPSLLSTDVGATLTAPGSFQAAVSITAIPATTITSASNTVALPTGVINVVSTTNFTSVGGGKILVPTSAGTQVVTYTGVTGTTFTGCTGGTGTMSTGGAVSQAVLSQPAFVASTALAFTLYRPGTAPADSVYAAHSPSRYAASMSALPQHHWYSVDDTVALPSVLATYAAAAGSNCVTESFGVAGNGHSLGPGAYGAIPAASIAAYLAGLG